MRERQLKRGVEVQRGVLEAGMAKRLRDLKRAAADTRSRTRAHTHVYRNKLAATS